MVVFVDVAAVFSGIRHRMRHRSRRADRERQALGKKENGEIVES
jgi:hypothetical protein